jgi:hypothetical protein
MKTKTVLAVSLAAVLVLALFAILPASQANADGLTLLKFSTMAGVPKGLTGSAIPIRNLSGGGLPWVLSGAEGKLSATGRLELEVEGLVIDPHDPTAISRGVAGVNPIASFRVVVSCLSGDGSVVNVFTDPFKATTGPATAGGGNAEVETTLSLPHPCIAPILFVTSPTGAWFAVTGN